MATLRKREPDGSERFEGPANGIGGSFRSLFGLNDAFRRRFFVARGARYGLEARLV